MKSRRNILVIAAICILIICGITYYYFFSSMSAKDTAEYVYIDGIARIAPEAHPYRRGSMNR